MQTEMTAAIQRPIRANRRLIEATRLPIGVRGAAGICQSAARPARTWMALRRAGSPIRSIHACARSDRRDRGDLSRGKGYLNTLDGLFAMAVAAVRVTGPHKSGPGPRAQDFQRIRSDRHTGRGCVPPVRAVTRP